MFLSVAPASVGSAAGVGGEGGARIVETGTFGGDTTVSLPESKLGMSGRPEVVVMRRGPVAFLQVVLLAVGVAAEVWGVGVARGEVRGPAAAAGDDADTAPACA